MIRCPETASRMIARQKEGRRRRDNPEALAAEYRGVLSPQKRPREKPARLEGACMNGYFISNDIYYRGDASTGCEFPRIFACHQEELWIKSYSKLLRSLYRLRPIWISYRQLRTSRGAISVMLSSSFTPPTVKTPSDPASGYSSPSVISMEGSPQARSFSG